MGNYSGITAGLVVTVNVSKTKLWSLEAGM